MAALMITTKENKDTVDGVSYHFSRSRIDYTILRRDDCVEVWKNNGQLGSVSNDCFWNGVNNQGKQMAKFLKQAMQMIEA